MVRGEVSIIIIYKDENVSSAYATKTYATKTLARKKRICHTPLNFHQNEEPHQKKILEAIFFYFPTQTKLVQLHSVKKYGR